MSDEEEKTIADEGVLLKYRMAGEIVNKVLKSLVTKCISGASVRALCMEGDAMLETETSLVLRREKELKRGIAFPVCISVNNCINHYSPLVSESDSELQDGDMVKLDFGAHIAEFISVVGHTLIVGTSKENKITGRQADVMLAAHYAAEAALRLVKPGNSNYAVTDSTLKIATAYNCKPIEGMLSFQLQEGRIDGDKTIIQNPTDPQRKEVTKCEFEKDEVYGVDIIVSTGAGIGREMDTRVAIYRKTDEAYNLKMKTSRELFSQVNKNYGEMPFNLRSFDDEKRARMGVMECVNHRLIEPYPVIYEKPNELVAQFKFTLLLTATGQKKITGLPFDVSDYQSEYSIDDSDLLKLLKENVGPKSHKKRRRKPAGKPAEKKIDGDGGAVTTDAPAEAEAES